MPDNARLELLKFDSHGRELLEFFKLHVDTKPFQKISSEVLST